MERGDSVRAAWYETSRSWRLLASLGLLLAMQVPVLLLFFSKSAPKVPGPWWLPSISAAVAIVGIWVVMAMSSKGAGLWAAFWLLFCIAYAVPAYQFYVGRFPFPFVVIVCLIVLVGTQLWVATRAYLLSVARYDTTGYRWRSLLPTPLQLLCSVILAFSLVAGFISAFESDSYGVEIKNISDLKSRITCVDIPPKAHLTNATDTSFLDSMILARLELGPADLQSFVKSVRGSMSSSRTDRMDISNRIGSALSWWDPDSAEHFKAIRTEYGTELCHILIDMDNTKHSIVYIDWVKG